MTHQEIIDALLDAGFENGWGVRGNKIVMWDNENPIPDQFADYVELDTTE